MANYEFTETTIRRCMWTVPAYGDRGVAAGELYQAIAAAEAMYRQHYSLPLSENLPYDAVWIQPGSHEVRVSLEIAGE